eukprot:scaffold78828_cov23-Tisochrysis_lutea.AAC.3
MGPDSEARWLGKSMYPAWTMDPPSCRRPSSCAEREKCPCAEAAPTRADYLLGQGAVVLPRANYLEENLARKAASLPT